MSQQALIETTSRHQLETLSKDELIEFFELQQKFLKQLQQENDRLKAQKEELKQRKLQIQDQWIVLKNKLFGKSSEKRPSAEDRKKNFEKQDKNKKKKVLLPSQRYPDAPLIEREVELETLPKCNHCESEMADSGMTENSEFLTVIPKQYIVVRQKRHKYRCKKCHGDLNTAPAPYKIKPGSSFSDEMVIDIAMSKYCDLIPIDRYAKMAGREGLNDLPPQSLIEQTHYLADHVKAAYRKLWKEVLTLKVLHADETPHRMLEQHHKKSWYLWGFSGERSSYFEIRDTRSGDVASELLKKSSAEFLVSDVFSGYQKSVRETNEYREKNQSDIPPIRSSYCNAHARRKFKESKESFPDESEWFLDRYAKIYRLEKIGRKFEHQKRNQLRRTRNLMGPIFKEMKSQAFERLGGVSSKSSIGKAMSYFLKNFDELILFTDHPETPIDNNHQERQLRAPVVGRKTWYGNHSKRGAETTAILFSLVSSCKLNQVNPREYFQSLVRDIHNGKEPYTPAAFADKT